MAESPAHRLGQIIGDALELSVEPVLRDFAAEHDLYLDRKGYRPARPGKKVSWVDANGNSHDLDFVLERGGTDDAVGVPAAFIESAWRRYTKHSKAKAQEMQGAIEPLLRQHANAKPFAGAVVGGQWTAPSITQMESVGFHVVHLPFEEIVEAFLTVGIDIATEETTSLDDLQTAVDQFERLNPHQRSALGAALRACAPDAFADFRRSLTNMVVRKVEHVSLTPLHGQEAVYLSTDEAITAIKSYTAPTSVHPFARWEIVIRFSNGDRIEAQFQEATRAVDFLQTFS